jgi:hypothetical protein
MRNKKGDLPVTILIIGVFVVCTLALVSFFYSSYLLHKSFIGIDIIEDANSKIESGNLNHYQISKTADKFSPGFGDNGFSLFKNKIIFSLEYNPKS